MNDITACGQLLSCDNTGNIGIIKIVSESSIAAGIRRIEAITGKQVELAIERMQDTLQEIGSMFNNSPNLVQALRKSIEENAELKRQAEEFFQERANNLANNLLSKARDVNGIKVVEHTGIALPEVVKSVAFLVRAKSPEHTVFIGATHDASSKPLLTLMITEDLTKEGMNASTAVRNAAKLIKGGGGGQPGFAQAGGKDKEGLVQAHENIKETLGL